MKHETEAPGLYAAISPEEAVRRVMMARNAIVGEVQKVVLGQEELIESFLIALFAEGHCLIQGIPGLGRSRTLATLARVLNLKFNQLDMTPDLTPEDLTGHEILDEPGGDSSSKSRRFVRGPIFAGIVLADEIDRAAPKTQAALLQAMHARQVHVAGKTYELPPPFLVVAAQNEVGQQHAHPLADTQRDRFMLSVHIGYPSDQDERLIVQRNAQPVKDEPRIVLRTRDILWIQQLVRQIPALPHLIDYAVDLTRASRPHEPGAPEFVKSWVDWGAGPRASEQLVLAAKARALLKGRHVVHAADVRSVARSILRHRIFPNRRAEQKGISADRIVDKLVQVVQERSYGEAQLPPAWVVLGQSAPTDADARPMVPNMPILSSRADAVPTPQSATVGATPYQWPPQAGPDGRGG